MATARTLKRTRTKGERRERLNDALAFRLQRHADRWIKQLQAAGFAMPDKIVVYVDPDRYDVDTGTPGPPTSLHSLGSADLLTKPPAVYVRPVDPWPGHDSYYCPIAVLIHELLHHHRRHHRRLLHWQVYWLADQFHAGTYGTTPMPDWISGDEAARLGIPPGVITQDLTAWDQRSYPDPREQPEFWGFEDDQDEEWADEEEQLKPTSSRLQFRNFLILTNTCTKADVFPSGEKRIRLA